MRLGEPEERGSKGFGFGTGHGMTQAPERPYFPTLLTKPEQLSPQPWSTQ
jgi:hypothetical protein